MKPILCFALAFLLPTTTPAAPFDSERAAGLVRTLAAEDKAGRLTGTEGARAAAEFIIGQLEAIGVPPLYEAGYRQPFDFTAGTNDTGTTLTWQGKKHAAGQVRGLSFSTTGQVSGPVVFAGYGISIPESQDFTYDSYAGLDVTDRIVLVLRYYPEEADAEARKVLARYSGLRYKALTARENGAAGLLVVTGPNSPNAGELAPMTFDTSISGSGIVAATITGELGNELLAAADTTLAEAQARFDTANPHITGFALGDSALSLDVQLEREKREGHNLIGVLGADDPADEKPWIVVGAHYDHLGRGDGGNSLARNEEVGQVHHGADDNASGVAAVLEAARYLATQDLKRHVAIAFWSGEELGVIGSARFLESEAIPADEIAAYVNFDMVGRSEDNKLTLQAVGSSPEWPGLIEQSNVVVGFDLSLTEDPYLPTDSTPFYTARVPTLNLFTGSHEDYHRPTDTAEKINSEALVRAARLGALVVRRLANAESAPEYAVVERAGGPGGGRDSLRAYTGTIPDYTTEVEGLRLSGVMAGGPAEKAGLKEGDIIVEFGGQSITNIYDYTYALDAVKIDEPVEVVVVRDGERLTFTMVPTARE